METLQKFFKDKKVLVTGHTGFKGSWLVQVLLNWKAELVGVALDPDTTPSLFEILRIKDKIRNHFVDIRDFEKVRKVFSEEKPEIVLHLAAQSLVRDSYDDPLYTFETNIMGSANILQAIKEVGGARSVIMITTDKVYKNKGVLHPYKEDDKLMGYDPYSGSKAGAEIVVNSYIKSFFNPRKYNRRHETLVATARSGNVIGGGDWAKNRLVPDIIRAVFEKDKKIVIRSPDSIRPWQYVLEPLYGYMLLAKELYEGRKRFSGAWNFGPKNENYSTVEQVVEKTLKILEQGSYSVDRDLTKHEAKYLKLNISKVKNILGWRPTLDLDETLKLTLDWYKRFYNEKDIIDLTNKQIRSFFNKV